jgi:thioredoxin-like negative regulator of GroEL
MLREKMGGAVTISVDKDLDIKQLPEWMRNSLIISTDSPSQATMIIRRILVGQDDKAKIPFLGRESDLADFSYVLIGKPEQNKPRIIVVSGLEGVGRKTFVKRAAYDYLGLETAPVFTMEETSSLDDLHLKLLGVTAELESRERLAELIQAFSRLSLAEQGREIARLLTILGENNQAPVIVDQGAMLDDQSRYRTEFVNVFMALNEFEDTYLVIIHNRRPDFTTLPTTSPGFAYQRLDPLKPEPTALIIQQVLHTMGLKPETPQIKNLALYSDGYPPAIEIVCNLIKFYGLDSILADKAILSDVQVRTFAPILRKLALQPKEVEILRILADIPSLPFDVIVEVIEVDAESCSMLINHLIDWSLVLPVQGDYAISAPIQKAVTSVYGSLSANEYASIAKRLIKIFWRVRGQVPRLGIVDATIHTLARGRDRQLAEFQDLIMPSQLFKVAKEEYDARNWDMAIDFAQRTLTLDPSRDSARIILCKALVRKELWKEAWEQIKKLQEKGLRAQFYCTGFLEWKRGNLPAAVTAFNSALGAGDHSVRVYRDLAHCLFRLDKVADAKAVLRDLPGWALRNSYIVDLAAQIAIAEKNWPEAEKYLADMEHVSSNEDYLYRRATYESARGNKEKALEDLVVAAASEKRNFEAIAQKADILIELRRFPDAEAAIDSLAPGGLIKKDVKIGLRCKMLLRKGKWPEAEVVWKDLNQKDLPVHQSLKREILVQKIADKMTSTLVRVESEHELSTMGGITQIPLIVSDNDAD